MARIRTIKPSFFVSEQIGALPFQWRLLFQGLWTQADREGRLEDRPLRLKAELFPYDDLNVEMGLGCLLNAGLIVRYEWNGRRLIAIPTWRKHQRPNSKEPPSELPAPPDDQHELARAGTAPARQEGKGKEGKGTEEEHPALRARFERFWAVYPKRVGKDAAWREWLKRSPSDDLAERMIAAVHEQRASAQWLKNGGEFIPHPRTWLHQGRWKDEDLFRRPIGAAPGSTWICLHVDPCAHRAMCDHKKRMPEKYPEREQAAS